MDRTGGTVPNNCSLPPKSLDVQPTTQVETLVIDGNPLTGLPRTLLHLQGTLVELNIANTPIRQPPADSYKKLQMDEVRGCCCVAPCVVCCVCVCVCVCGIMC